MDGWMDGSERERESLMASSPVEEGRASQRNQVLVNNGSHARWPCCCYHASLFRSFRILSSFAFSIGKVRACYGKPIDNQHAKQDSLTLALLPLPLDTEISLVTESR
jgi:hypothetical protein